MKLIKNCSIELAMGAIFASVMSGLFTPNAAAAVTITYENPNIYSASSEIGTTNQVDFETLPLGTTNNYGVNFSDDTSGHNYTATYDLLQIGNYGGNGQTAGADYRGQFAANGGSVPTTNLTFANNTTGNNAAGIQYFGLFYSSIDSSNQLTFYNGSTILSQFTFNNISQLLNYNSAFVGGPYNQEGAFFNFYADAGEQFTKIQFTQIGSSGFESDNHTFRISEALAISGAGVDLAGVSVTAGTLNTKKIPEPCAVLGTLAGCALALRLKQKSIAKKHQTIAESAAIVWCGSTNPKTSQHPHQFSVPIGGFDKQLRARIEQQNLDYPNSVENYR
jgi:hypothetical protein